MKNLVILLRNSRFLIMALLLPLWIGCTPIITTKGKSPTADKIETTAIQGWDHPSKMRELGKSDVPEPGFFSKWFSNEPPRDNSSIANEQYSPSTDLEPAPYAENICPPGTVPFMASNNARNVANTKIRASGYGAPPRMYVSEPQRRLLAIRAAKLDAMRTLSERISGVQLWGSTTLSDLALSNERINLYTDAFISGARTLTVNHMDDNSYEVVMEVQMDDEFLGSLEINQCVPASSA